MLFRSVRMTIPLDASIVAKKIGKRNRETLKALSSNSCRSGSPAPAPADIAAAQNRHDPAAARYAYHRSRAAGFAGALRAACTEKFEGRLTKQTRSFFSRPSDFLFPETRLTVSLLQAYTVCSVWLPDRRPTFRPEAEEAPARLPHYAFSAAMMSGSFSSTTSLSNWQVPALRWPPPP